MIRWIASYPKSGNTWVRLFLMAYENPDGFTINARSPNHTQDTNPVVYQEVSPVPLDQLTEVEGQQLRGAVLVRLSRVAKENTGGPVYLKTHTCNVSINGLAWVPPEYTDKSLYILRDPRDVAVSSSDHFGKDLDDTIADMGNEQFGLARHSGGVTLPLMTWSMHVQSWLRDLPYDQMAVRYEDLLAEPDRWFQAILNFFQMPFDRSRFYAALELTSFDALRKAEDKHGFEAKSGKQDRFFRQGRSGAWRDVLTAGQQRRIETDHADAMQQCGYS